MSSVLAKLGAAVLNTDGGRKTVGWVLVAVCSPLILIVSAVTSLASGEAQHNTQTVEACFYGAEISDDAPSELKRHIEEIPVAFALLDSAVSSASMQMEDGASLDPIRVKAVFLALCFGEPTPTARAADRFVDCFYSEEDATRTVESVDGEGNVTTEEETYTRTAPVPLYEAYEKLQALLGREITEDDYANIEHIYTMIAGDMGDMDYDGSYHNFKKVVASVGIPNARFHDLSHTFATLALQNGVDVKTLSSMLGHYSSGFTLDTYTHITDRMQQEAAEKVGSFMEMAL